MCRYSSSPVSSGASAAAIGVILMMTVATAWGENTKAAWRQFVHRSSVNCLTFDGPICWAGTAGGLVRLDERDGGMTIVTNLNSPLPSNAVNALAFGRDSSLLIGTSEGLARLKRGVWLVDAGPGSKAPRGGVTAILTGDSSDFCVGLEYGGVYKVSNATWTSLASSYPGFPLAMIAYPIRSIARDRANRLWMTWRSFLSSTVACLEGSKWTLYDLSAYGPIAAASDGSVWMAASHQNGATPYGFQGIVRIGPDGMHDFPNTNQYLQSMAKDRNGKLWIAGTAAIADFSSQVPIPIVSPVVASSGMSIMTIAFDTANSLLAGLGGWYPDTLQAEIVNYTGSGWLRYRVPSDSCPTTSIDRILIDHAGNCWMYGANQVRRFDGSSWTRIKEIDTIVTASSLYNMALDRNGSVWFASLRSLIRRTSSGRLTLLDTITLAFLSDGTIADFAVDSSGRGLVAVREYVGSYASKIVSFDLSSYRIQDSITIPDNAYIQRIVASPDGSVWCGLSGLGVGQWRPGAGFRRFDTSNSALYSNSVYGLAAGPDSSIWIGGAGLVRYKAGTWTRFDTAWNALPGKNCTPLTVDKKGTLWAAVYRTEARLGSGIYGLDLAAVPQSIPAGLARFDGVRWTGYTTVNSGLPDNTVTCVAVDDSGTAWIGTSAGVGIFRPGSVDVTFKPSLRRPEASSVDFSLVPSHKGIIFRLPRDAKVTLMLFDLKGRLLTSRYDGQFSAGEHLLSLSGMVRDRNAFTGKLFLLRLEAEYGDGRGRRTVVLCRSRFR